ncbi:unnamed protein product [Cochlearia groenlandica]
MKITNRAQEEAKESNKKQNQTRESRNYGALCCSNKARLSVSSSSSLESDKHSKLSDQHGSVSSLTHYMVQEKLEQMITEAQEATLQEKIRHQKMTRQRRRRSKSSSMSHNTKFIVMMAMEKCSYDPREDFRASMVEMIVANKIKKADELRSLLEYYLSMNPREYRSAILEIFYEVCADLFLC